MSEPDSFLIAVLCLWFALVGSCVGSFLNVLVYRLPRRKSLVHPPSHCPRCGHTIRWYDNVPVVGWIKLRGKCRDCRLPISFRYPCVEGFCGILFSSVFVLIHQRWDIPLETLMGLTLLASLGGAAILTAGLIAYDQWTR